MGLSGIGSAISKTNTTPGHAVPARAASATAAQPKGVTVDKRGTASNPPSKLAVGSLKVSK